MRAWVLCSSAALLTLLHLPLLSQPYFWDEAGQFIPAALDIYYTGTLVPHSTIPNVHPPGVMLCLAAAWRVFGYSIVTTRLAMLAIALLGCWSIYRLALEFLCPEHPAAEMTLALVCLSPMVFSQSIMALLDMPAMTLTALGLLLFFRERFVLSAIACVALVLVKESGALLPAILGMALARERRVKQAALFLAPALPLIAWMALLQLRTGHWFGNTEFEQYNLTWLLHPVRLGMALFRRLYYLFISTGYAIGTAALLFVAWVFRQWSRPSREWRIACLFGVSHVIAMCVIGGAVLERYLLPVLPITLAAFANALCCLAPRLRNAAFAAMCAISAICIVLNPFYPFPLENNLAWTDFVAVQHEAAEFVSTHLPADAVVSSKFPFAGCMRRPELGYTSQRFRIEELKDFRRSSLIPLRSRRIDAFAIFDSTWDPMGVMHNPHWMAFLRRFYRYEPDVTPDEIPALLGWRRAVRFERHGQWIEVFVP